MESCPSVSAPIADIAFACERDGKGHDKALVETAEGGNGLKHWRLLLRPHGIFLFEEMTLRDEIYYVDDDGNEGAIVAEAYWMPTHVSGLFESKEAAREDALATLPWLREALRMAANHQFERFERQATKARPGPAAVVPLAVILVVH